MRSIRPLRMPGLRAAAMPLLGLLLALGEPQAQPVSAPEKLATATPRTTSAGHAFTAPAEFTLGTQGRVTLLAAPEGDSVIALVDVDGPDAESAMAQGWAAYREVRQSAAGPQRPLKRTSDSAPRDGWDLRRAFEYETSPNERATVFGFVRRAGTVWIAVVVEASDATFEKRAAPISLLFNSLRPKGYARESFAGRTPKPIDAAMLQAMKDFVARGMRELDIPGVAFSLIDRNQVVFEGGLGVREIGKPAPIDAGTLFMAASNTKTMTSLLMAQAVDAGKLAWDQPVVQAWPGFALGDGEVTRQLLVKHLVCACTGLPRQDMEWIFEFGRHRPKSTFELLRTMKPTSRLGEVFQYSNLMVGAAGYVAASKLVPGKELGAAYDQAMRERVFVPLGMKDTTFDFRRAQSVNHARPHGDDVDGRTRLAAMDLNYAIVAARPAGGVWTSTRDMSRYVLMELAKGRRPDGKPIVSEANHAARYQPQILVGEDTSYGLAVFTSTRLGVQVVQHGGDLLGYHSNMFWLPELGIGATILTNSDSGVLLRGPFQRKLMELLFDGKPEADEALRLAAVDRNARIRKERERLVIPPEPAAVSQLAAGYSNGSLGQIAVRRQGSDLVFDFGEWKSRMATRRNDDGSTSFITIDPGVGGFDFVVDARDGRPSLVMRTAQQEYRFVPAARP